MPTSITFARRWNSDGSIDSICSRCFRTIASAQSEIDLQAAEQRHSCLLSSVPTQVISFAALAVRSRHIPESILVFTNLPAVEEQVRSSL